MIFGTGVDIVEVFRMRDAINKWGMNFLSKIFTDREMDYSNARRFSHQHFAARFAAKEAVFKAFGEGRKSPMKWTDIEVLNNGDGKPAIEFHSTALELKKQKRIDKVIVSMSHSKNYAVANAILLRKRKKA
ncbi:MAG: holo-ACP synthase [Candidatus Omnitrophica bacterium]|nr:holo-ACP synthase [Candidatus Omnitrophota bacterium]